MDLNTASAVVSFAENLEVKSAEFYESAALHLASLTDCFRNFARENKKNVQAVKRAYYSSISDALETGFAFQTLSSEAYAIDIVFNAGQGPTEVLKTAIANESKIQGFYQQAAACSEAFMADVPKVFKRIAGNREQRKSRLKEHLDANTGSQ